MPTVLSIGSRGDPVRSLQTQLQGFGFDPGPIDAVYGPRTASAVEAWKRARGYGDASGRVIDLAELGGGGGAPAPVSPEERLKQLAREGFGAERQAVTEDLARQMAQLQQGLQLREAETQRGIGQIETDRPEHLGRLASGFAARGAYHSGPRQEAVSDMNEEFARQIEAMRLGLAETAQRTGWEKEALGIESQRILADLARQQEAQEIEWTLQAQAEAEARAMAARGGGGGGGRGRGRGGGGAGAGISSEGFFRERKALFTAYQSQGLSVTQAASRATHDMRVKYPNAPELWLYEGDIGRSAFPAREPAAVPPTLDANAVWNDAYRSAQTFVRNNPGGTLGQFVTWYKNASPRTKQAATAFPTMIAQAFRDAGAAADPRSTLGGLGGWR
jgi:peptidoglycan hydrolase-like protein with peptidoglycan-binding domain